MLLGIRLYAYHPIELITVFNPIGIQYIYIVAYCKGFGIVVENFLILDFPIS